MHPRDSCVHRFLQEILVFVLGEMEGRRTASTQVDAQIVTVPVSFTEGYALLPSNGNFPEREKKLRR